MTKLATVLGLALAIGGCASSTSFERAQKHAARADAAAAVGDYRTAAREQNEARNLRQRALDQPSTTPFPAAPTDPFPVGALPFVP